MGERLVNAARYSDIETVKSELVNGADINAKNNNGDSALIWACANVCTEIVELLLVNGADVNTKDRNYRSALMWATNHGHTKIVEMLLAKGADVNAKDVNDETALMWATNHGHTKIVELLIARGADVNVKNKNGETALTAAITFGQVEIVKLLLANGADTSVEDVKKRAAAARYSNIVTLIEKHENKQKFLPLVGEISTLTPAQIMMPENLAKLDGVFKNGLGVKLFEVMKYKQQESVFALMYDEITKDEKLMEKIIPIMQATFGKTTEEQNNKNTIPQINLFNILALQPTR